MRGCYSSGNGEQGYYADEQGQMTVSNSSSDCDGEGYGVGVRGQVTIENLVVDGVTKSGQLPLPDEQC